MSRFAIYSLFLFVLLDPASAQVISVPGDHITIQAAIDVAVDGDTVVVDDGTYQEQINFSGKAITVGSRYILDADTSHIYNTVVDGSSSAVNDSASVVYFTSGEDTTSVLIGFTITGGSGTPIETPEYDRFLIGGGIHIVNSGASIVANRIIENAITSSSAGAGAGIGVQADSARQFVIVERNRISGNSVSGDSIAAGGGIALDADARVAANILTNNSVRSPLLAAGGGLFIIQNEPKTGQFVSVLDNRFLRNRAEVTSYQGVAAGAGLAATQTRVDIARNQIAFNQNISISQSSGGGMFLVDTTPGDSVVIRQNLVANNGFEGGPLVGGGLFVINVGAFDIRGNTVRSNTAALGGGAMIATSDGRLFANDIDQNTASGVGGGLFLEDSDALIHLNRVTRNRASHGAGVFAIEAGAAFVQNIVAQNVAIEGGGGLWLEKVFSGAAGKTHTGEPVVGLQPVWFMHNVRPAVWDPQADLARAGKTAAFKADPHLINNTIVDNTALGGFGGGGLGAILSSPVLMNTIVRGNTAGDGAQIDGAVSVTFSNIEGGHPGFGNIDEATLFDGDTYLLAVGSPEIDAGNPDPIFDDVEDAANSGSPLRGLGGLRNDMGFTGGNVSGLDPVKALGPRFRELVQYVASHPSLQDQNAAVDSFLTNTAAFPLIEGDRVATFLYLGTAGQVNVPGDANGWNQDAFPMSRLGATNLWFRQAFFEPDARLDYKFVINGQNWILDPRNPNRRPGGFGPNSELSMPQYEQPVETVHDPAIDHGQLDRFLISSASLGNSRTVTIYLPPGYADSPNVRYPVIVFHDGGEYLGLASAHNVLDNLIASGHIQPLIGVFVPPVDRNEEYAFGRRLDFEAFIADELMGHVDEIYRTRTEREYRGTFGLSFGGLISAQLCINRPNDFGLCGLQSPAFWPNDKSVLSQWLNGPLPGTRMYIDWGTYELGIMADGRTLRDRLTNSGAHVVWSEWHDGHSWGNWRGHLDDALGALVPGLLFTETAEEAPTGENRLMHAYPNPLSGVARLSFETGRPGRVGLKVYNTLGQLVGVVVDKELPSGIHSYQWDASNHAPGIYLYQLRTSDFAKAGVLVVGR